MATTVQRRAGVISPDPSPGPDYLSDDPLERQWADPPGLIGWLSAVQNDAIGGRVMLTAFTFFLLAGLLALLMRVQLVRPQNNFFGSSNLQRAFYDAWLHHDVSFCHPYAGRLGYRHPPLSPRQPGNALSPLGGL